jgi:hypothetical protein
MHVACVGNMINAYKVLIVNLERKRPLRRHRRRWENDNIRMDLRKIGMVCTGCIWRSIGTSGGLLWTRKWHFGFHKWRGISWLAEWFLASQGLCSMVLIGWLVGWLVNQSFSQLFCILWPLRGKWFLPRPFLPPVPSLWPTFGSMYNDKHTTAVNSIQFE